MGKYGRDTGKTTDQLCHPSDICESLHGSRVDHLLKNVIDTVFVDDRDVWNGGGLENKRGVVFPMNISEIPNEGALTKFRITTGGIMTFETHDEDNKGLDVGGVPAALLRELREEVLRLGQLK